MIPEELIGPWAELLAAGLHAGGVRHLIVSPGSRSTPFVLAALRAGALRCWSVADERSAGFFALGQARVTGEPTALLCTSGTAPAHYLPALLEAAALGTPLVVVTADRPHELVHCGAPQTIEQTRLFAAYVRHAVDLGNPDPRPEALRGVLRRVTQAVVLARGPAPGPVHVNARAPKPLEPVAPSSAAGLSLAADVAELIAGARRPGPPSRLLAAPEAVTALAGRLGAARRGLIVCGALTPSQAPPLALVHDLARRTGFPLVCETTSQLRTAPAAAAEVTLCDRIEPLLLDPATRSELAPDLLLQLGAAPLAAAWEEWLRPPIERHVLAADGWADPTQSAATVLACDLTLALTALLAALAPPGAAVAAARRSYRQRVDDLGRVAATAVDAVLNAPAAALTEGRVVTTTLASLSDRAALVVGSSLVLRAIDLFPPAPRAAHPIIAHRGANGIDGLVSAAAGVATVHGPTTLLVGDVSLLHDVGGLWTARHVTAPLAIVILNDGGGRIFEALPVARVASAAELSYFTTPHAVPLAHAAALFGHRYERVQTNRELELALTVAQATAGVTLIDALLGEGEPLLELTRLREGVGQRLAAERQR